jgi:rfaE bifunctional protein kinase chain/domain
MKLTKDYRPVFDSFKDIKVVIIGDVMVDTYLWGRVERISPEAPVPIVAVDKRANRLGGAANVALNVKAMGATPILVSVIGKDLKGDEFITLVEDQDITTQGIIRSENRVTTTKFRIIGNNTQMLRVDEEIDKDINNLEYDKLITAIDEIIINNNPDVIVFQDYNKGVITTSLINEVTSRANEAGIDIVVDPKKKNFSVYSDLTLFKPNLKELKEGLNTEQDLSVKENLVMAIENLMLERNFKMVMTTLSEKGIIICYRGQNGIEHYSVPSNVRNVSDVSGAGDTVISVASLCLASGLSPFEIAAISNLAGGLVCEEVGVVPVDKTKLLEEVIRY